MTYPNRLPLMLFILRLSIAAFFAVWAVEKIAAPELAAQVFAYFYVEVPSLWSLQVTGTLQLAIVTLFTLGVAKTWTYGALLAMHTVSTLATWQQLLTPFTPPNHLFWAAVPTLAAIALLFVLRDQDRITLPHLRRSRETASS